MLAEGADGRVPIPDTVQAFIAARIDGLPRAAKTVLQRAAVIGRIFWRRAVAQLSPEIEGIDDEQAETLLREAVELAADRAPAWIYHAQVRQLARFLTAHGRAEEAAEIEASIETPARIG